MRSTSGRPSATGMAISWDERREIPAQDRAFNQHEQWDFQASIDLHRYPLLLHVPYFALYRKQVSKQADLVLALHWRGDRFTPEEKARAFEFYESVTVRDSSLSASTQAVVAAEVGQLELAYDYLAEAAFMDLHDLESNTGDGLHIASLAGAWIAVVAGLGGLRDHAGQLSFRPQLPPGLTGLRFRVRWRGVLVRVAVTPSEATYTIEDGPDAEVGLDTKGRRSRFAPICRLRCRSPRSSRSPRDRFNRLDGPPKRRPSADRSGFRVLCAFVGVLEDDPRLLLRVVAADGFFLGQQVGAVVDALGIRLGHGFDVTVLQNRAIPNNRMVENVDTRVETPIGDP